MWYAIPIKIKGMKKDKRGLNMCKQESQNW